MNRLFINSLWLFCSMLPLEAWTQGSISRSAIEKLADPEPIGQQVMQFDRPDATFLTLEETDAPYVLEYVFANRGGKPLTIDRVTVSCGCLSAEYDKRPVPVGGKGSIRISFNPKGYSGDIYRQAFVYTSLSEELPTARLTLTGKVAPSKDPWRGYPYHLGALRARQNTVTFGVKDRTRKMVEVIACGNSGDRPLTLSVKRLPGYLKFKTSHEVINPGEEADLIFLLDGALLPAEAQGTITVDAVIEGTGDAGQNVRIIIRLDS